MNTETVTATPITNINDAVLDKYCIIRGDRSGVFAGTVHMIDGQRVLLAGVRRLWYWDGAASISQLAVDGTTNPNNCKFTVVVDTMLLTDVIEIIPTTEKAEASIKEVSVWRR